MTRPGHRRGRAPGVPGRGRRLRDDQHVRREPGQPGRVRDRRPDHGAVARPARGSPARSPTSSPPPTGCRAGCSARSAPGPSCRPSAMSPSASCATPTRERGRGCSRGGADALIIETCPDLLQAKAAIIGAEAGRGGGRAARARHRAADHRDHRHDAARQRDRRRADRARTARHRHDRPELRHRAWRDERAPALPRRALADPDLVHAQRRPARADRRRRLLPADAGRAGAKRTSGSSASSGSRWSAAAAAPRPRTWPRWSGGSAPGGQAVAR